MTGLMTQITNNQKYGMIEAISHLIHRDYEAIVKDFVLLDFIPDGVNLKPIMPVLAKVFDQALEGGGAKNINFQELAADLAQITFDYPFRIPPYFALIIRAIGVLEGIALVGNPDFAIVDEAYPYIAQRLLTDSSPRLREALRYTIYGRTGVFDADRFIDVMEAFETFTTSARSGGGDKMQGSMASLGLVSVRTTAQLPAPWVSSQQLEQGVQMRTALAFIVSDQGQFFREFILDEVVKGIDAITREQLAQLVVISGLNRLNPVLSSMILPGGLKPTILIPVVTQEDEIVLNNVRRIVGFLSAGTPSSRSLSQGGPMEVMEVVRELLPVLPTVATHLLPEIVNRLTSRVMARTLREIFA
jgi:aarF domain-containing kinase